MPKVKLTKNELKKQKDDLKMYKRYLPTLQLKKQQLQMEIKKVEDRVKYVKLEIENLHSQFEEWVAVFGENFDFSADLITLKELKTSTGNIAGVIIPVFESARFETKEYDLFVTPLWVDLAIEKLKDVINLELEYRILEQQVKLLRQELKTTTQRVNLFEKIKIPETQTSIKKISIYLGDQQTAAVVRGKISKNNLTRVS
ncbi:MAG: V-type ATP synthase subunit D [Spirochaetales bacterium]|nr:V-type ATP synthase subunit D [Spirochaetales bacterium]